MGKGNSYTQKYSASSEFNIQNETTLKYYFTHQVGKDWNNDYT